MAIIIMNNSYTVHALLELRRGILIIISCMHTPNGCYIITTIDLLFHINNFHITKYCHILKLYIDIMIYKNVSSSYYLHAINYFDYR